MPETLDRRDMIADAAIQVIADGGVRALTHRAVDAAAQLPTGTTSYQYRTRRELLRAILIRITEIRTTGFGQATLAAGGRLPATRNDRLAEATRIAERASMVVDASLTTRRTVTIARFAMQLEVSSDPELAGIVDGGYQFEQWAVDSVRRIGARRPKRAGRHLVAFVDGLVYQHLVGTRAQTAPSLDRDSITLSLTAYLVGLIPD